jgi:hypothetical protein
MARVASYSRRATPEGAGMNGEGQMNEADERFLERLRDEIAGLAEARLVEAFREVSRAPVAA